MPVYIREYKQLGREAYGGAGVAIQAGLEPAIKQQAPIAIGASSVQSEPFDDDTALVLITTNAICHIEFGTNPAANTNKHRLAADAAQFFAVKPGSKLKVAVITGT